MEPRRRRPAPDPTYPTGPLYPTTNEFASMADDDGDDDETPKGVVRLPGVVLDAAWWIRFTMRVFWLPVFAMLIIQFVAVVFFVYVMLIQKPAEQQRPAFNDNRREFVR
jgi:hypothetical protein